MGAKTGIEWCDATMNPITGCWNDCPYCYARRIAVRFKGFLPHQTNYECIFVKPPRFGSPSVAGYVLDAPLKRFGAGTKRIDAPYPFGFAPTFHRYRLEAMRKNLRGWKEPRTIFWGSMCDMFGDWVPDSWIEAVFEVCESAPQHRYLFLTKNWLKACNFHFEDNWWVGRTITHKEKPGNDDKNLYLCCGIPKKTEPPWIDHPNIFLSCEPLHGPISDIPYYAHSYGYKWVILGAETGNRKGKIVPQREWIEQIVHDCDIREVPVFMKDSLVGIVGEENMRRELPWEM